MAQRRMISRSIVCSGRFLKMKPEARLLYYDLCISADDDGVSEAYSVLCLTGASEDALNTLVEKKYITFLDKDELVVHISDWNESNHVTKQKYKKS